MKRTKKASGTRGGPAEGSMGFNPPPSGLPKWAELIAEKADDAFVPYEMSSRYERGALVQHGKFGKGYVTSVEGNRVEVVFEDAVRKLAHGVSA
ncbi:MAG: hypothetical protein JNK72_21635 [Myxococcales bacterium]|nr:hypothetical protein [Myxococcales bacterium]